MGGGTPGGDFQTQWSLQVLTNVLDYGMDLQTAVDSPRWFHYPGTYPATIHEAPIIDLERAFPEDVDADLARRGHTVKRSGAWPPQGAVQLVEIDPATRVLRGASDPRA